MKKEFNKIIAWLLDTQRILIHHNDMKKEFACSIKNSERSLTLDRKTSKILVCIRNPSIVFDGYVRSLEEFQLIWIRVN